MESVPLPPNKTIVGFRWVYSMKIELDDHIDHFETCLVAKVCAQILGLHIYEDNFSHATRVELYLVKF